MLMYGGGITTDQTTIPSLIRTGAGNGGGSARFVGVDLSVIATALYSIAPSSAIDVFNVKFINCALNAGLTGYTDEILNRSVTLELYGCGSGAAAEYQFYKNQGDSIAEDDTSFYRDASTAFPSGQKVSIKVTTNAYVQPGAAFCFDLPARWAELSSASTDTIRIYLLSSDSGLTDQDIHCILTYPDGTNIHVSNLIMTKPDGPFVTGTALTANSDAWTGRTTETRYQIDIDTSVDVGADCVPILRISVGKPSTTVYFDTTIDVVA